ncbi:3-oxoacyl-[acyl-carrier-protein] synthase 3 B, chloroplastic-like [Dioscorea cayenensis subsp. rotundata]|uniref:beta-ketoacyl-[acyl-carrier-protein] synthase III n=1 Tax=Dioscorea cayennensis subsp. rotundata TaxID=55577 RepID=A0AB40AKI0_DIOCR|nr:3-oxoacyl-[acyl-carrier-protein] synthase 3 B, chloroplastic-like [Dioscorea cayenensis subsp. rotundata]
MASASGLVYHPPRCCRPRKLAPFRFSRSGFFSIEWNPARAVIRCCAVESGVEGTVLGAAHSKARLPRLVGMGSKLVGCGSAVPKLLVSNDDLAQIVETSDEWISVRTGIRSRRVLSGNETLNGLAVDAAKGALDMAQVETDDVDLVIMCTSTPDDLFGGGARVQRDLGCKNAWAFDVTAACSGFVIGLITATRFIKGGGYRNILVIGADALSRYVDWTDRGTCILFGDAAGAVLVQACSGDEDGMLGFDLHSDGQGQRHLHAVAKDDETKITSNMNGTPVFSPKKSSYSCIQMNGKEVFRFAVRCVPQSIEAALEDAGLTSSSIDWLLLHQANQRIIDAVATRLQIPSDKVVSNLANYGNTSAASIPLALDEAVRGGKVKPGNTIATAGFGAGLSWGSAIIRWG